MTRKLVLKNHSLHCAFIDCFGGSVVDLSSVEIELISKLRKFQDLIFINNTAKNNYIKLYNFK